MLEVEESQKQCLENSLNGCLYKFFGFERDAEKFLGYPHCCVRVHNLHIPINIIHLYSLIKEFRFGRKSINDFRQFLVNLRFIHHNPCKINCIESINLERRFDEHFSGKGCKYTIANRPEKVRYTEAFKNRSEASKREAQIKGWPRTKKLALIKGLKRNLLRK